MAKTAKPKKQKEIAPSAAPASLRVNPDIKSIIRSTRIL
jgi:hypothetical protein